MLLITWFLLNMTPIQDVCSVCFVTIEESYEVKGFWYLILPMQPFCGSVGIISPPFFCEDALH